MNVTEAIKARHSIWAFLPRPVEKEKLDAVLAACSRFFLGEHAALGNICRHWHYFGEN
jgi:nitroreductase